MTTISLRTRSDVQSVPASAGLPSPAVSVPPAPLAPPGVADPVIPTSPAAQHTVADLLDAYEREYVPDQAPATQKDKRNLYRRIRLEMGSLALTDLSRVVLCAWRDALRARVSAGTVVTYMHAFSAALTVAVQDYEWLAVNPMAKVHKPSRPPERVRFLDGDEQRRLLDACQRSQCAMLYPVVLLALTTGARKTELLMLTRPDLDVTGGAIRLQRTKNKQKRLVPMPQMTGAVMQQWIAQQHGPYVFPGVHGAQPAKIIRPWLRAVAQAGLVDFSFHDLRHTAASYLAMSGVRIEDIAEILGHKNLQTTKRYRHVTPAHTAEMVEHMAQTMLVKNQPPDGAAHAGIPTHQEARPADPGAQHARPSSIQGLGVDHHPSRRSQQIAPHLTDPCETCLVEPTSVPALTSEAACPTGHTAAPPVVAAAPPEAPQPGPPRSIEQQVPDALRALAPLPATALQVAGVLRLPRSPVQRMLSALALLGTVDQPRKGYYQQKATEEAGEGAPHAEL